ncbi:nocturnin-like isoform 1-T1 [Menidia menidia]
MQTAVCQMGGGATRLYGSLTQSLAPPLPLSCLDPPQPALTNLEPDFCQRAPPACPPDPPACPLDREQLLRQCEEALRGRPPRLHRKFVQLRREDGAPRSPIRVMQWNILAQALGEGVDGFVRCPPEALSWSWRKPLILEEILSYRPHLLCLQEVDHFHDALRPALAGLGYAGHFCPKPWSPCLQVPGNNGPDGCALFYDRSRFQLLDSTGLRLNAMMVPTNQVAVVTTLRCRDSGRSLAVASVHLKARAGWEWLRSAQGCDLLRHLAARPRPPDAILVCGDFNAAPAEDVYRRFAASPLGLDSACKQLSRDGLSEPEFTSWKIRATGESRGTLDYVWFSRRALAVDGVLELPSEQQVGPDRLPSRSYPSDHLSLVCDFSFRD